MSAFMCSDRHISALANILMGSRDRFAVERLFTGMRLSAFTVADLMAQVTETTPRALTERDPLAPVPLLSLVTEATTGRSDASMSDHEKVFWLLVRENVRSLQARYPDSADMWEGFTVARYDFQVRPRSMVEALKLLDCYEYQACEHPDWAGSAVQQFCDDLRRYCISQLPGYDAAPWFD